MTRIDLIPENQFSEKIKQARENLDQLKASQPSGQDSNVIYATSTASAYDFAVTGVASGSWAEPYITLTSDHQEYVAGYATARVYSSSTIIDANELHVGDVGFRNFYSTIFPPVPATPHDIYFQVGVYNDSGSTRNYYFKMYYLTTDTLS